METTRIPQTEADINRNYDLRNSITTIKEVLINSEFLILRRGDKVNLRNRILNLIKEIK